MKGVETCTMPTWEWGSLASGPIILPTCASFFFYHVWGYAIHVTNTRWRSASMWRLCFAAFYTRRWYVFVPTKVQDIDSDFQLALHPFPLQGEGKLDRQVPVVYQAPSTPTWYARFSLLSLLLRFLLNCALKKMWRSACASIHNLSLRPPAATILAVVQSSGPTGRVCTMISHERELTLIKPW